MPVITIATAERDLLLTVLSDWQYVGGLESLDGGRTFPSCCYDLHLQPVVGGGPQAGHHKHVVILQSRGWRRGGEALDKPSVEAQHNRPLKSAGLECEHAVHQDAISRLCTSTDKNRASFHELAVSFQLDKGDGGWFYL